MINWSTNTSNANDRDQRIVSTWYNVIQYNMIHDLTWYNIMWYDMIWYVQIHCPKRVLGFLLMTGAELVLLGRGDYEITPCCVGRHHSLDDGLMREKPFNMINLMFKRIGGWWTMVSFIGRKWGRQAASWILRAVPGREFGRWNGELSAAWKQEFRMSQDRQKLMGP